MFAQILRAASVLALVGVALMVWSLLVPTPMPVLVAMSVGQGLGTLSLAAFLYVVVADLRRAHLERPPAQSEPPGAGQ
jgi:tellurite resistance protein TehA-like permease